MYVQVLSEFNICHKKEQHLLSSRKVFSAILKAAKEVDTRTLSGNKFHSLLIWHQNEWRP